MNKLRLFFLFAAGIFSLSAAEYPTEVELWKSFTATSGSRVHVNRVFVKPDGALREGKKFKRQNENIRNANARYKARKVLRNKALERICSSFVPGENAFLILEKYDLYHERVYTAYVVTQQNIYFSEVNEVPEKGTVMMKYPLNSGESARFAELSEKIKPSHGSCDMTDSRNYPTFLSVKRASGKWETAVCSATNYVWINPNDKQREYFDSVTEFMKVVSELNYFCSSRQVPPIVVKKK